MRAKYIVLFEDGSTDYVYAYNISEAWDLAGDMRAMAVRSVWRD